MATPGTATWLERYKSAGVAASFVIEGFDTVFSTDSMPGAYSSDSAPYSDWADPTGGMIVGGTLEAKIELYEPDIDAPEIEVTISDKNEVLISKIFREGNSSGNATYLTSNVPAGSTSAINVKSTTGFASSGNIYIGDEVIGYTTTTVTTFATITRAKYTINQTDSGGQFSSSHLIGANVTTSATTAPAVTDYPRTWYGRWVHLFLHVKDPFTGLYCKASAARKIFSGRMTSYSDDGKGNVIIKAKSAMELLHRPIGADQWSATINEGVGITDDEVTITNAANAGYGVTANLGLTGNQSHAEVADALNAQFAAWESGASITADDIWSLELTDFFDGGPPRYVFHLHASTAIEQWESAGIRMHRDIWNLLGWPNEGVTPQTFLEYDTTTHWYLEAPEPPLIFRQVNIAQYSVLELSDEINTFATQAATDAPNAPPLCNGVVEFKDGKNSVVYAVLYTNGSPSTIQVLAQLDKSTGSFRLPVYTGRAGEVKPIRLGDQTEAPTVRQVWYQHGQAGTALLKMLLSTGGASGFNHADYDYFNQFTTGSFGASVPASLVDVDSWEALNDVTMQLLVSEPKPFYEYLEQVLAASNRYVVWKSRSASTNPKLSIVRPALDTSVQASWSLTESNKTESERLTVERAPDGIINRVVIKYGQGIGATKENALTLLVENIASQSDYGRRRTITIEAPIVTNAPALAAQTVAPAMAYFSRPLAVVERSITPAFIRMAPGDVATLTDPYIVDPLTGTRGATLYCWVLSTSFDLARGKGKAKLVFLPEKDPTWTAPWAPSARVNEASAGGGYNAGTRVLTLKQHEFGASSGTVDALYFANGDPVHIVQLDDNAPLEWFDTIDGAPTSTTIRVLIGLGGFDSTKRYVIEYDDISTVSNDAQFNHAFIADSSTLSTGYADPTPYEWGSQDAFGISTGTVDYSIGMFKPNGTYADQGEPLSIHKAWYLLKAANNALGYRTRNVHISDYFHTDATQTGTTTKLVFLQWIPIYGHFGIDGTRGLVVRVRAHAAGGGSTTVTIASSPVRPTGSSFTAFDYPAGSVTTSFNTSSATAVWSDELTLTPAASAWSGSRTGVGAAMGGTWISVYIAGSGGGTTAHLSQVWVAEAGL